jgi:hypothetical protein
VILSLAALGCIPPVGSTLQSIRLSSYRPFKKKSRRGAHHALNVVCYRALIHSNKKSPVLLL